MNIQNTVHISSFRKLKELSIVFPRDYSHERQFERFRKQYESAFYKFRQPLTARHFQSDALSPGRMYKAEIVQLAMKTSLEMCYDFLRQNNAKLVGAEGLFLLWEGNRQVLPRSQWIMSLPKLGSIQVGFLPLLYRYHDDDWRFNFGGLRTWEKENSCLLMVTGA